MRFWDSSALLPLLVDEPARERLIALLEEDAEVLAWWGTPVEIASASRALRGNPFGSAARSRFTESGRVGGLVSPCARSSASRSPPRSLASIRSMQAIGTSRS